MKKWKVVSLTLLCLVLAVGLFGICLTRPVVQVALQPEGSQQVQYLWVLSNGMAVKTKPFSWDCEVFSAPTSPFGPGEKKGGIPDPLTFTNSQGEKVAANETAAALLEAAAAQIDHSVLSFTIYEADGRYFAFAQLNVNWQSPGVLYEFHPDTGVFQQLHQWESVQLLGLAA